MDKNIKRMNVTDLEQGLMESSATPVGTYRTFWIMKLRYQKGRCKLPRGFGYLSGKYV